MHRLKCKICRILCKKTGNNQKYCKKCGKIVVKKQHLQNTKQYRKTFKGKLARKRESKKYRKTKNYKIVMKRARLKYRYNLSLEEFDKLTKLAGGKCMICGKERKLTIDHNHKTGKVRGLICQSCNSHLAWFENYQYLIFDFINFWDSHTKD